MPRWVPLDFNDLTLPSETERAWLAGFWDGEGSTTRYGKKKQFIRLSVSQKDTGPELLNKCQAIAGCGQVRERPDRPGVWVWSCTNKVGVFRVLEIMWPYLGQPKRNQAVKCGYDHTS